MEKKKITKIVLIVLSIALVILALVSSTYALFSSDSYGAQANDYTTGMLSIEAVSKSDTISLTNALPMTDEEGKETTPYVFSVKNIGNLDYQFDIELLSTGDVSNTFPASIIKLQIDDGDVTTLAEIGGKIKEDVVLLAGESLDVSIRIWLSKEGTTNDHLGMSFNSKIVTNGQAIYTSSNSEYQGPNLAEHISNLYLRNKDTDLVVNNGISYRYASIYDKDDDETTSGGLMNDREGSMSVGEDDGNIRYYGANPNNYIYFNCDDYNNQTESTCEMWRIIGVFDGKVKIMRNGSIGSMSWDQDKNQDSSLTTYNNDWSTSSLQEFLNGKYYNRGKDTSFTYYTGSSGSTSASINLESIGIKNDKTRELISESLWYLKGWNSSEIYSDQMYNYERKIGKVFNTEWPTTLLRNIGIAYPSDYGYAADFGSCSKILYKYSDATCMSTNWMNSVYGSNYIWLMAPYFSDSYYVWYVNSSGYASSYNSVYHATGVVPVLHLSSELSIEFGDGSENNPYKLDVGSKKKENFVEFLTNKYMSASPAKATVANNGINYYYAPSVNMMNDGMNESHVWEDGENTGNIRYYGATPANYIDIGDRDSEGNVVPWRIIGVFKNIKLADGTTDTLIKVIRDEPIGEMDWDDNSNDWSNATLMTHLNEGEYYTGLSQKVKEKIAKIEWNLGGYDDSAIYSNEIYLHERGELKAAESFKTTWKGNIALMYPSDYGYAIDLTSCSSLLYDYDKCVGTNWLFNSSYQWLLTPLLSYTYSVWYIKPGGGIVFSNCSVVNNYGVSPVLYLKSDLSLVSGDGSSIESAYVVK